MRVLSLYGVLAIALLVCCLAPGDVLSKPLKKKRGQNGQHAGKHGRDHPRHGGQTEENDAGNDDEEEMDSEDAEGNRTRVQPNRPRVRPDRRGVGPIRPRYVPDKCHGNGPLSMEESPESIKRNHMKKAMGYMSKYGYMGDIDEDDWDTDSVSEKQMKKSIKKMQKFMGLKPTGELDEMTMMMMDKPRCGLPDMPPSSVTLNSTQYGPLPYNHFNGKWNKQEITFRILNYPSTMPSTETREAIIRAFLVWSDVTPLTFREVGRTVPEYADFYIKFGIRSHGDAFSFDGRGGVLAHAFLPGTNSGDIEGDVHFDDDELFTYASYLGTNLFQVAAHEIGHSLGLYHSNDPTALMAPFYPGYQPTFYLPFDDVAGIQSLYGSNPNPRPYPNPYPNPELSQPTNPPTNPPAPNPVPTGGPAPNPDPCRPVIDATTIWRGEFFAFTGGKYGRIRNYIIESQNGGSTASNFFQSFPSDIDALYESPTYKLLMFKGPSYYVYEGLVLESGPLPITSLDPSLPSDIDAVVSWAASRKTYFFKGDSVWRFDELSQTVDSGWPQPISEVWVGLPNIRVTAAWHDEEQFLTYFMSGDDYYRYDDLYAVVELDHYPRDFISDYFGCF